MEKKLLTPCSVLNCDDCGKHFEIINSVLDSIRFTDGYTARVYPINEPNEREKPFMYPVRIAYDFNDIFDGLDFKNGFDLYEIPNGYLFRVFGQSFSRDNGKTWQLITWEIMLTKNEYRYY